MGSWRAKESPGSRDGSAPTPRSKRVFVVEDEVIVAMELQQRLSELGFQPCGHASRGEVALQRIAEAQPDVVLMDINLGRGRMSGIEVAKALRDSIDVPVVFLTAYSSPEFVDGALEAESFSFVTKPFQPDALRANLEMALLRHEAKRRIADSERRLVAIFGQMAVGVAQVDLASGRLEQINEKLSQIAGRSTPELLELGLADLLHHEDRSWWAETLAELRHGSGQSLTQERRLLRPGGEVVWAELTLSPMWIPGTSPTGCIVVVQDVTERRRAVDELRSSQRLLAESQRIARLGSATFDLRTGITTWTEQLGPLLGRPTEGTTVSARELFEHVHPDDRDSVRAWAQAFVRGHRPDPLEARVVHPDGTVRVLRGTAEPACDEEGRVIAMTGIAQDITETLERDAREGRLLAHKERLELVTEGSQLGFWEWDPRTGVATFSPRWARILGMELEELQPTVQGCRSLVHPEDRPLCDAAMEAHLEGITPHFEAVHRMRHADGSWRYILSRGKVFGRDEQGRASRFCGTHMDITAEKEAERLAIETSRAKAHFLASMSHELRTPLNAVLGLSEAMLEGVFGELSSKQERPLQTIHDSGRDLLALVNDVIDIARLEAGQLSIDRGPVALRPLVQECVGIIREATLAREQQVELELGDEPIIVTADARRLEQILASLLSNATKFGSTGSVITVGATADATVGRIELWVANEGSHIAKEDRERIFRPFVSVEQGLSRSHGGAGLGLTLVKHLVERHAGTVRVEDHGEGGVRFVVSLPWTPEETSRFAGAMSPG